jgi:GNAT superfamily N-acetyltransferase
VKTFYYGHALDLDDLRAATRRCCEKYGATSGRVVWFHTAEAADMDRTRLLLKEFAHDDQSDDPTGRPVVGELDDCEPETAATFGAFAHAMADHGFDFLQQRRMDGHHGPVLVSQDNGVIVGAIGPLAIMPDRAGARMLLPQYFGVLPGCRGGGHGRALWRAAQRWGVHHHADYQLLQARVGAASDNLFLSEGLRSLGFAATVAA